MSYQQKYKHCYENQNFVNINQSLVYTYYCVPLNVNIGEVLLRVYLYQYACLYFTDFGGSTYLTFKY